MAGDADTARADAGAALATGWTRRRTLARLHAFARHGVKDTIAAFVASIVLIANIVSFGALMFPGDLSGGIPLAVWAMLIGSCVGGIWIALATSLAPIGTGIDSPTGAVFVSLSAATSSAVVAAGGTPHDAIQTVMLIFTAATFVSGALFYALGARRWGRHLRFVPYFVVGGFLAATGWFLIIGGLRTTLGRSITPAALASIRWSPALGAKLAAGIAVLLILLNLRRASKSAFALPAALLALTAIAAVVLHQLGLTSPQQGWYLPSLGALTPWFPFEGARHPNLTWASMLQLTPELLAVSFVALVSLVTKVSSIEVARQTHGNLDREFRAHGIANVVAAGVGGIACGLQIGSSRLLQHAGAATRMSGAICAVILGIVALAHFDLLALIPIPIIAGLVFFLGYNFVNEAFSRLYAQRAWRDLLLAVLIAAVCVRYGYVVGVLLGLVLACVMFAVSYARLGVVRRHVTRAVFTSYVDRSPAALEHLRKMGDAIQVYSLSGYIFFGSSESVFERIRNDIEGHRTRRIAYIVLDFSRVSGTDASALASLTKLGNFCGQKTITVLYCALPKRTRSAFERAGLFRGKHSHEPFADVNVALAWCEDQLLAQSSFAAPSDVAEFEAWLQEQLGAAVNAAGLMAYLERKNLESAQVLYRQGDPADSVDIVAAGSLGVDIQTEVGTRRVRRITTHTVLGEMGFFRRSVRSATVASDGPATVYTLSRASFERMQGEHPELANAFAQFIIRVLSDRVDAANRTVAALSG
ncbi:MAG TPA: SulP family inorganic anion transporter [Burkholderiales bacterium]|nr:SulP family inorganic anion transporter [Burkholderiales bacterium]